MYFTNASRHLLHGARWSEERGRPCPSSAGPPTAGCARQTHCDWKAPSTNRFVWLVNLQLKEATGTGCPENGDTGLPHGLSLQDCNPQLDAASGNAQLCIRRRAVLKDSDFQIGKTRVFSSMCWSVSQGQLVSSLRLSTLLSEYRANSCFPRLP